MSAEAMELGPRRHSSTNMDEATSKDNPYKVNADWELDRAVLARRSEKRAWIVASVSICLVMLSIVAIALQGPMRRVETVAIVVDKMTGASHVETRLAEQTIPALDALDMSNAAKYVLARERYMWMFLQQDYNTVARMSTKPVFAEYTKQFQGDDDLTKKFGSVGEYRIDVVSVRVPPGGRTGNKGEVVVTFDKTTRDPATLTRATQRYEATLRFEYRPTLLSKEVDRMDNPFGFVATAYRADVQFTPPSKPKA